MANFMIESGANPGEVISTLNYLLSNLGNAPLGLTINRQTGQIINNGTNTLTGYLYRFINISWANNIQGLYSSATANNQTFYGINNNDNPTYPTSNTNYVWASIYDNVAGHPTAIGPANGVSLWFTVGGGRTITFVFSAASPGISFVKFTDGSAIDLDAITSVGNSAVIGNNTVLGSNVTIGNNLTIGNYWTAGTNGNIGANLTISGLTTNSVLNASTVGTTQLTNYSVTNIKYGNSSITSNKVVNYTLIGTDLANATITSQQVQDYSLVGTDLANLTVDTQQINNLAITNAKINSLAVTNGKISDYTITGTKLANATVTSQQIAMFTVTGDDIANATITSDKLSITSLSSITANAGNITAGSITGSSAGGSTLITGYTAGATNFVSNVALINGSATNIATYTVSTPVSTRITFALNGSVNLFGNEANLTYYNAMSGNVFYELLYSNSTVRSSVTMFSQGTPTLQRVSGTSYNYRIYNPSGFTISVLLVPDTYTIRATPNWFYRNNSTGNLVTPTNESLTYQGMYAVFQANIT